MPKTKWTADPDGSVWEGEDWIADIHTGDGGRDAELAVMWAAAPETKRQRDALLVTLRKTAEIISTMAAECDTSDITFRASIGVMAKARALIAECESSDAGEAAP